MNILITGGTGLLGNSLVEILSRTFDVYATYNDYYINKNNFFKMDITNERDIEEIFQKIEPDILIHTAALTNVDLCEENKVFAKKVNFQGTKYLSKICASHGIKMIYISTDYVFDGNKGNYTESDVPKPINYYGKTKLDGEEAIKNILDEYIIIRTSLYGWNIQDKLSFSEWIIKNLSSESKIKAITDQYSSLMFTDNLSEIIANMVSKEYNGIFNVSSFESISKYEFALKLAEIFGLDSELISPILSKEIYPLKSLKAQRPKDTSLNTSKIIDFGLKMPSIRQGLENMKLSKRI